MKKLSSVRAAARTFEASSTNMSKNFSSRGISGRRMSAAAQSEDDEASNHADPEQDQDQPRDQRGFGGFRALHAHARRWYPLRRDWRRPIDRLDDAVNLLEQVMQVEGLGHHRDRSELGCSRGETGRC